MPACWKKAATFFRHPSPLPSQKRERKPSQQTSNFKYWGILVPEAPLQSNNSEGYQKLEMSAFQHTSLKALDTFCNCQRPVLSLAVSQQRHGFNRSSKLQENNKRTNRPCCTNLCAFRCLRKASDPKSFSDSNISVRKTKFVNSEGVVSILSTALHCLLSSKFFC